ncbi:MAG TPA: hypothetical protein VKA68_07290 [bacterium]|nr:hypothetical protein [bacterium]
MKRLILLYGFLSILFWQGNAQAQVNARMLQHPDVSQTHITFVYAGDIWVVPKEGGTASRLSSPKGEETFPRFSPDGSRIAFSGNYDGNTDMYTIPTLGGTPERITHHPAGERVVEWYPDGKYLYYLTNRTLSPTYSDLDGSWVYINTTKIAAVPLRKDVPDPLKPRNDEVEIGDEEEENGEEESGTDEKEEPEPVEIDLDGFEQRAVLLPPDAGNYTDLQAVSGKVIGRNICTESHPGVRCR